MASKVLTKGKGGSWGVVSTWASPVAGMTRACLSRMTGLRRAKGETSAVESSQTGLPSMWARVMAWLKEAGEGTAALKVMPAPMRTASALMPGGGEHGDEQGGLVLAVAVLVAEDVAGLVRLEAADAEGYADVADLGADVAVDGAGFFVGGGFAGGEGGDLGADVVVGFGAGAFEGAIPGTDFLPGVEVGPGDLGEGRVVAGAEGGILVELEESVLFLAGGGG